MVGCDGVSTGTSRPCVTRTRAPYRRYVQVCRDGIAQFKAFFVRFLDPTVSSSDPMSNRVTLIDAYSSPGYISSSPPSLDPPIRFLATGSYQVLPKSTTQPFAPPNLLLSPSAAFLSLLEATVSCPGLLLLLPLPHIPRPPPRDDPEPIRITTEWSVALLEDLNALIGADGGMGNAIWDARTMIAGLKTRVVSVKKVKPKDVLESGMYI